ncbi:MAG TPA: NmrA family NAD(P)-binding protein [Polyangiaceae bacterium]|jgi:uncharacterized protein YbjT (DUF2867 family)|nr:NmrA family NAD(P)-binding protein [Polyangiaceae bacterium]
MRKPTILVTAAAGKTGRATTLALLAKRYPVRALVRRHDQRADDLRHAGATVVVGSLEDICDLRAALSGVERAYFCPPLESGTLRKTVLFAEAAREAKLEVIVALNQWLSDPQHPALHATEKWLSRRVFEWLPGPDVVTINPGFFADNYMAALESIAQLGLMALPLGTGRNAPPSNEDIARVVVGALTQPERHAGKVYRPTGPRLLDPDELAATFAKVLGRPVRYQNAPLGLFLKVAKSLGFSDYLIAQLNFFLLDYQRDSFAVGAPTNAVLEVSGSEPESFEVIVRRYVAASAFARPSFAGKLRAVLQIVKALLTPAPNLDAIATRLELPRTAHAALAADSKEWAAHTLPPRSEPSSTPSDPPRATSKSFGPLPTPPNST